MLRCRSSEFPWLPGSSLTHNVKEGVYGKPNQASLLRVILYSYFPTLVHLVCQQDPLEKGQVTHFTIHGLPWWLRR